MSFASRLKQAMNERNMSQVELALHIGKGKSSISQYLSGKNTPRDDVLQQIAEVLDCSVEWLNGKSPADDFTETGLRNVSVAEAAKRLGKSQQFVRAGLQTQRLPFGFAVKNKTIWSYHISPKKFNEYIGA